MWGNHLREMTKTDSVYSMPDSGLFLSTIVDPHTGRSNLIDAGMPLFTMVNAETPMPIRNCVEALNDSMKCMQFSMFPQFFTTPLFIIESEYDQFSLFNILSMRCLTKGINGGYSLQTCSDTDRSNIELYRTSTLEALGNFTKALKNVGYWAPACVQHGFTYINEAFTGNSYRVPSGTGLTISESIARFMQNVSAGVANRHADTV